MSRKRGVSVPALAGLCAVIALAGLTPGGDAGAGAEGRSPGPLAPADGVLFGAHVQMPGRADPAVGLAELEGKLGRRFAIDHYYRPWGDVFPDGREAADIAAGRIPMISWGKTNTRDINSGAHDAEIRARAEGLRDLGQPVLVRWFWEMGGNRNIPTAGEPADYIAAWRRIHGIATEVGATNAAWVWCPDASDFVDGRAQSFYPGDDVVDWTCADGYNFRHPSRRGTKARSFADTFAAFYEWAKERPKPIMVGEYGVVEDAPGDKAAWVEAARVTLAQQFPEIAAVVYFHALRDRDGVQYDWRMDTSPESLAAFQAMGADPYFNPQVEITLPETSLDAGPDGLVAARTAEFAFSAGGGAPGGFACSIDGGAFAPCTSPQRYENLADGTHEFEVRGLATDGRPDPTPARRSWTIDATAPAVTEIGPADGATGVDRATEVWAAFSEDVQAGTIRITLTDERTGSVVAGTVKHDPATRRATFRPESALLPLTTYRALLAAGVADTAGNALPEERAWTFTTAGLIPGLG
jgi:hypothetical protein